MSLMAGSRNFHLLILISFGLVPCLRSTVNRQDLPRGHGQPLGRHRDSEGHVDEIDSSKLPSPKQFWDQYASIRKPVVFRGAAKHFPAFQLWTDQYLTENYGDLEVKLEAKREKDHVPVGDRGLGRDTIRSFLETYQKKDSYTVSQLPDPLSEEVRVLPFLMCGTFSERILEANLWLSSGGTRSMLHKDADNAINCLLNGTKDWILIHPDNEGNIPVADGDRGYGGFATLDVESVNLIKYPKFKEVRWQYANMTPGDCLFLPYSYWHQVRSYGSKNMAVSVLFSRLTEFDPSGCEKAKLEYTALSDVNMVWTYPGHGPQTMGNVDPFEMKDEYLALLNHAQNGHLDADLIFEALTEGEVMEDHEDVRKSIAEKVLKIIDVDNKGYASREDVQALTLNQLKQMAGVVDPDPANTEEYEFALFELDSVRSVFKKALDDGNGKLTLQNLIKRYEDFGGSAKVATELFYLLEPKHADFVSEEEMTQRLDQVLKVYLKKKDDDKSGIYYDKAWAEDKEIMKQTMPSADNLDSMATAESSHTEL